jgi:four helix bundle protein
MSTNGYRPIEQLDVFLIFENVGDEIWAASSKWQPFAKNTIGEQLVRSIDSVGANLVEGDSRGSDADSFRFFRYARSSAREARLWLRRAVRRELVPPEVGDRLVAEMEKGALLLNNLMKYRRQNPTAKVRESVAPYNENPLEVTSA